ncbi:MAG: beta-propeller domain-containing protein [Thermoplasmata archaeon]|nr:MAG: beta-propeller domain-containing protein [Thermoplasmata archaeon]
MRSVKNMYWKRVIAIGVLCVSLALLMNMTIGNTDLTDMVLENTGMSQGKSLSKGDEPSSSYYIVVKGHDDTVSLVKANDELAAKMEAYHESQNGKQPAQPGKEEKPVPPTIIGEITTVKIVDLPSDIIDTSDPFIYDDECGDVKNFESLEELKAYLENHTYQRKYYYYDSYRNTSGTVLTGAKVVPEDNTVSFSFDTDGDGFPDSSSDHSTTNIQVAGVDEGDIVKNDGRYAYVVTRDENYKHKVIIADVYPAGDAKILSQIKTNGTIREIYITADKLVTVGSDENGISCVHVFDITERGDPDLLSSYSLEGSVSHTRRIGNYLYLVGATYINSRFEPCDLPVPADKIYYFSSYNSTNQYTYSLPLTTIVSINIADPASEPNAKSILSASSGNIYVSMNNIYITYTQYSYGGYYSSNNQKTVIHRISIAEGEIRYRAMGEVPGYALNRFSMGEHMGYLRIATSGGSVSKSGTGTATNQVYVLDMDLNTVGKVEDIAPGEKIYSARFMGNRAYLVTFKKVDPFYVIDLSNPRNPAILGELKIPGYSDYLHPYDENHVIGLGKDTVEAEYGNFAWYQGVKLSLFDVTDVSNPKEISKFIIGDRGTSSPALNDPHAFLFSREKNLLVLPINLYEINHSRYPNGAPANTHGEYKWSGVYVFDLSADNGFALKGTISHPENTDEQDRYYPYYYYRSNSIKRSFYIGDVLYTCSDHILKMNDLDDLHDINELPLAC